MKMIVMDMDGTLLTSQSTNTYPYTKEDLDESYKNRV